MSIFDWTKFGSGSPIVYGAATVLGSNARPIAVSGTGFTYIQASGATPGLFTNQDGRYKIGPSGTWDYHGIN